MEEAEILKKLAEAIETYNVELAKSVAKEAVERGIDPMRAINEGLALGMKTISQKFDDAEIFLLDLVQAGGTMNAALEILRPEIMKSNAAFKSEKVVIGTVSGDIHEIGKNIVSAVLVANGFDVIDLGIDVPTEKFVEAVKKEKPAILGLSSLLTTTMGMQKKVIDGLREENLDAKVMIGGAPVNEEWAQEIGAYYAKDANETAKVALKIIGKE